MLDYAGQRPDRGRLRILEAQDFAVSLRRLDWLLLFAVGAAAVEPWPPFSITAQTTSGPLPFVGEPSNGPQPHHHD